MLPIAKLENIRSRLDVVQDKLLKQENVNEIAVLSKEFSRLQPIVEKIDKYLAIPDEISEIEEMLGDPELKGLAEEELSQLRSEQSDLQSDLLNMLLADNPDDARSVVLEIRAGTWG